MDFGTYNTVAALSDGERVLLFDGMPLLSSAVYADRSGALVAGRDAAHLARLDPAGFEPNPKRRIDDTSVLLGAREYPVVEVVAAVLGRVADEARRVVGRVPETVLTYPAAWGRRRQGLLVAAARRAGLPVAGVVSEPVAAAYRFAALEGVAAGRTLVVFDFGAGTLDVAAVRAADGGHQVVAYDGVEDLGGLDIDEAVVRHVGRTVAERAPAAWARLTAPGTAEEFRARRLLWDDARAAKEMLSRTSLAPLPVPGYEPGVHLTRDELNDLCRPVLDRAMRTLHGVLAAARVAPPDLAGIVLVGGSSRLPLVADRILRELGVAATVTDQPEVVVAHGALTAHPLPVPA